MGRSKKTQKKEPMKRNTKKTTKKAVSSNPVPTLLPLEEATQPKLPTAEKININQLFSQALVRYNKEKLEDKKDKLKEISHLASMAEEYLSTFALIGYSLQNEKVVIFNMSNSKDEAALVDLLRATFIELVNNRP